jgi:hypothetical protein
MGDCEHLNFRADAKIGRLQRADDDPTIVGFTCGLEVMCADCKKRFEFIGLPMGFSHHHPTVSIDGLSAEFPIKPIGEAMAMGLPEFSVKVVDVG